nr:twin-arginine translocase TatA/TatE family subunit [Rubripirellula obstinata]
MLESFDSFGLLGFGPGPMELAIIAGVILLLFGSSKLPSLMRNLGRSTNEFKRGMSESSLDKEEESTDRIEKS